MIAGDPVRLRAGRFEFFIITADGQAVHQSAAVMPSPTDCHQAAEPLPNTSDAFAWSATVPMRITPARPLPYIWMYCRISEEPMLWPIMKYGTSGYFFAVRWRSVCISPSTQTFPYFSLKNPYSDLDCTDFPCPRWSFPTTYQPRSQRYCANASYLPIYSIMPWLI